MLDALKSLIVDLTGAPRVFAPQDQRVAAAALLAHVAAADGEIAEAERERIVALISERFSLDRTDTRELVRYAVQRDREAVDFEDFANLLARTVDEAGRRELVAMMWEMARADGVVHEFEESVIWRVADRLGVRDREAFAREANRGA